MFIAIGGEIENTWIVVYSFVGEKIFRWLSRISQGGLCGLLCIPSSDFPMEAGQIFILFRKTRVNNN